jgi:hypothetical protein
MRTPEQRAADYARGREYIASGRGTGLTPEQVQAEQSANLERLMNLPPEEREFYPPADAVPAAALIPGLDPDAPWNGRAVAQRMLPYGGGRTTSLQPMTFDRRLPPVMVARAPWFERREEAIFEFVTSQDNWAARRKPGDGTFHAGDEEFLQQLIDRYGDEEVTVVGLVGYPIEFSIPFYKLGTFGAQLMAFRNWVTMIKSRSAGGLPDPESDEADHAFGDVMQMMSQGQLVPEIAKFMGWNTFLLGKFVYRYTKKYPEAARDLSLAYDLGLQTLTAFVADQMQDKSATGRLTNMDVAVLQSKLANFRTLALRLAGSAYATGPSQKTNVNIMPPSQGGLRIDVRVHGGGDDDVVDVMAHLPRLGDA